MKSILIHLEDSEHSRLVEIKESTGKDWKGLLMSTLD